MIWQWGLLFLTIIWMPAHLLGLTTSGQSIQQRASFLSALLPVAVPLYLAARMNQTVRYYWRFSLYCTTLGLTSAWAVALSIALNLVGKSESIQHYVARSFYYFAGPILGWTINIEGEEHLQPKTSTVFVGNHQSQVFIPA